MTPLGNLQSDTYKMIAKRANLMEIYSAINGTFN